MNELDRQIQREAMQWVRSVSLLGQLLCAFAMLGMALFVSHALAPFAVATFFCVVFGVMRWAAGR